MDTYNCKNRILYHLIWGHPVVDVNLPIVPRIPKNIMETEDNTIKRICVAPSADDCLTGIGPSNIGMNFLKGLLDDGEDSLDCSDVYLPFTLLRFEVSRQDPNVLLPGRIAQFVPDAFHSQEHWITTPIVPKSAEQLWLVDGKVIPHSLYFKGEKRKYFMISDTQWSTTASAANMDFVKSIIEVTKTMLVQNYDIPDVVSKISLQEQVNSAERRKRSFDINNKSNNRISTERDLL